MRFLFSLLFALQPNITVFFLGAKSIQRDNLNFHEFYLNGLQRNVEQRVESKNARGKCVVCCLGPRGQ